MARGFSSTRQLTASESARASSLDDRERDAVGLLQTDYDSSNVEASPDRGRLPLLWATWLEG